MIQDITLYGSLPWYDYPCTHRSLDKLWQSLHHQLPSPTDVSLDHRLNRSTPTVEQWQNPALVLSQCCGPDLFSNAGRQLEVVGRPILRGLDCDEGAYYSFIVTQPGKLLTGRVKTVINSRTSWSGHFALQEWLASNDLSCSDVLVSGSHAESLNQIRQGTAEVAAIDAFSFGYLDTIGVSRIDRTRTALAPPFVKHRDCIIEKTVIADGLRECLNPQTQDMYIGFIDCDMSDYRKLAAG